MDPEALSRTALLLGGEAVERLGRASVLIVGLGGVGAYAAEVVARSGVGRIALVDGDVVARSNLNRQLPALTSTLGMAKAEVVGRRLRDVNPGARVDARVAYIAPADAAPLLQELHPDFVVDAIDAVAAKVALIEACLARRVAIISSMGAGGRTDPARVAYADIAATRGDGLAREVRRRLRRDGIATGLPVVWSDEPPRPGAVADIPAADAAAPGKRTAPGTVAWLPAMFGLMLGAAAVNHLIAQPPAQPPSKHSQP